MGGARSGKSALAEKFLAGGEGVPVYLATATVGDDEMHARITRHRTDRGSGWQTIEVPLDLAGAIGALPPNSRALIDCATLWLSNHLLAGSDLDGEVDALLAAVRLSRSTLVVVSNEVGWGIVPATSLGREFRDAQGRLNQRLAEAADLVVGVMAGLPFSLKGTLPADAAVHHRP